MGAKASKPAAQAATRKFPTRTPGSAVPPPPTSTSQARAPPQASFAKDDAIRSDSINPNPHPDDLLDPNPEQDSAFSSRLRQMGVATPNPTLSNSSTARHTPYPQSQSQSQSPSPSSSSSIFSAPNTNTNTNRTAAKGPQYPTPAPTNATLGVLEARRRLVERADAEVESNPYAPGAQGREFVDVGTLRQVLSLRVRGTPAAEIESRFKLRAGSVQRLGPSGVVVPLGGASV